MAANVYHTVIFGDTVASIAKQYNTTVAKIVSLNNLPDANYIVVGQVLLVSGTPDTPTINTSNQAAIVVFGLRSNTQRSLYAAWKWNKPDTEVESYQVIWYYDTGEKIAFVGSDSTTTDKQAIYNAPEEAKNIRMKVKPIAKTYRNRNDDDVLYWTAEWSTEKWYCFEDNPPETPAAPTVEIDKYTLTAKLDNLTINATDIEFEIVRDNLMVFRTGTASIFTGHASFACIVEAGSDYKVRCRSVNKNGSSEWSPYSSNIQTLPTGSSGIHTIRANSETSMYLEWFPVQNANSYDLEYTTKITYFDGSDKIQNISGIQSNHYEKTGLTSGEEYFFRVRAVNSKGASGWTAIRSMIIGTKPAPPSTWMSTSTAVTGEPLKLYWVHNSEDGSSQTFAELEINVGGVVTVHTIQNSTVEEEKDKTSVYTFDTSPYLEGTKIKWRVRTRGITQTYSDWSIERLVDIYAPAVLSMQVSDYTDSPLSTLSMYPIKVKATAGPNTQHPISYHLSIFANQTYETVDSVGNVKMVNLNDEVYSKHFDIATPLDVVLSANDLDLANNVSYTIKCVVAMDTGLKAEDSTTFKVAWTEEAEFIPNAELSLDKSNYSMRIRPYSYDKTERNIVFSIFRREFDGTCIEIASGIKNNADTFVVDPHPSLDYARYRLVAISNDTGAILFYDVPSYPINCDSVIIQWDETWSTFNAVNDYELTEQPWSGSMIKIPYNIDVSEDSTTEVTLVKYAGRKNPVSYYGTHQGTTASWSVEIPKTDKDTIYALRRLMIWPGNVYVREPSGVGYWANIKVSFSQKHMALTVPVSFSITRVEGGM